MSREMTGKTAIIFALLIVLLLTQTQYMRFFFNTALGRLVLIVVLLALTYCNQMWGLAFASVLIVAVSISGFKLIEPLDNMDTTKTEEIKEVVVTKDPIKKPTPVTSSASTHDCVQIIKEGDETNPDWQMCVDRANKVKDVVSKVTEDKSVTVVPEFKEETTVETNATENNMATEGFDTMGLERRMQIGKNSNSIPVRRTKAKNDDFNILPNDLISYMGFSPV